MRHFLDRLYFNNLGFYLLLCVALILTACGGAAPTSLTDPGENGTLSAPEPDRVIVTEKSPATLPPPAVSIVTVAASATAVIPTQTATTAPSPTPTISSTPDPYAGFTIDSLAARPYGGGAIQLDRVLGENSYFTRWLFSYPSDGLTIYGFLNLPKNVAPPFPVVIALHGYIEPEIYDTIDYTTRYADALARAGYLVLHPNLRGYPPSEDGENLFRVGMAIDVLNLIALIKEQGRRPGVLEGADPNVIGLWGHSMGGGISTRVITISPDVRAAVLYGAMSGDEQKNYERIFHYFSNGTRGQEELNTPAEAFQRISPVNYLDRIQAAVSIHHGKEDPDVPLAWSLDLCQRLQELGKSVECHTYPGQPHTFHDEGDALFMQRMIEFFDRHLRSP
jgi:dienelactone hydrolase